MICEHLEAFKLLVAAGANPNIEGEYGGTALQHALQQGHLNILAVLDGSGAETCEEMLVDAI